MCTNRVSAHSLQCWAVQQPYLPLQTQFAWKTLNLDPILDPIAVQLTSLCGEALKYKCGYSVEIAQLHSASDLQGVYIVVLLGVAV